MGKEIRYEIRDNYNFYKILLEERKSIFQEVIEIKEIKKNNKNILETSEIIKHSSDNSKIELIVNVKINDYKFFQFKLKCKELSDIPFFRYDNDGETHRNYDEDEIPLRGQSVNTPHFHFFNEKGINIAYQTATLKDEAEKKALEDINLCIAHYFHEANIRLNGDDFPKVSILPGSLNLDFTQDDPNSNIRF
jgi:hypothetical protein